MGYVAGAFCIAAGRPAWLAAGALLLVLATGLTVVFVRMRRDIKMTADGIWMTRRGRSEHIPVGEVKRVTTRGELHWSSTQWGRGWMPVSILFLGLVGGRTVDLFHTPDAGLSRRSWRCLCEGLVALPYGRPPKRIRPGV